MNTDPQHPVETKAAKRIEKDLVFRLPAGHAWLQPEMTVVVTAVKLGEWVAYENATNRGCSRYDYFERNADPADGPVAAFRESAVSATQTNDAAPCR